jgi:hypothetical protein
MEDLRRQRKCGDFFFVTSASFLSRVFLETDFRGSYRFPFWFIIAKGELRQPYLCGYAEEDV